MTAVMADDAGDAGDVGDVGDTAVAGGTDAGTGAASAGRSVGRSLLARLRHAARQRVPEVLPGPAQHGLRVQRAVAAQRVVLAAGAFDLEWYEAQTGTAFGSIERACRHYLWQGRRAGLSPHPLFEPSVAMPKTYRTSSLDPLVANLTGRKLQGPRVHPTVPESWTGRDRKTRLPKWLAWAKAANVDSVVPSTLVQPSKITWGEFRAGAIAAARNTRRGQERRQAPVLTLEAPHFGAAASPASRAPRADGAPPRVSVIMPTWNRAGMLRRAVESVQAQTLTDWELLIVDDGSDDDTLLVLEGIAAFEPRLRVVAAPHGGVCKARNLGLDAATGTFVAFLDTDNTWTPEFLERSVDFAVAEGAPWVHAALQVENKTEGTRYRAFEGSREQLLHGNYIDMNVLVADRAVLMRVGPFDETLRRAVDYDLILRLSEVSPPRLVPMIGAIYQDNSDDPDRISVAEPVAWNYYVSLQHLIESAGRDDRVRVPGRVSVVLPVRDRPQEAVDLVARLRKTRDVDARADLEVIVVVSGPSIQAARAIEVAAVGSPNVTVLHRPTEFGWAASIDLGAAHATGEYLVAWRVNCNPHAGWWPALRDALERPGVGVAQALAVRPDGRISSAGAVFVGHDPYPSPLLAAFPVEDAEPLHQAVLPAAYESVVALRSETFRAVSGVDAILNNDFGEVDLSLRVRAAGLGETVLSTTAQVTARSNKVTHFAANPSASVRIMRQRHTAPTGSAQVWQTLGFEQTGRRVYNLAAPKDTRAEEGAQPVVRPVVRENPRQLRWALDCAADADPAMHRFAQDLAAALRGQGQQVHVDSGRARDSIHRDFDDVALVLRGGDVVRPRPGGVSMLWVLSHHATVTQPECAAHDRVFAASTPWARAAAARWGLPVDPLVTCVDAALFRPDPDVLTRSAERDAVPGARPQLVFAGDAGGILRPAVKGALDARLPLTVYGAGWAGLVPADVDAGEPALADLPAAFGAASAVLCDHPVDLRHDGFVDARVPQVLACGGRLLCDDVAGLADDFGLADEVVGFGADHDLRAIFADGWPSRWPDVAERVTLAERVRAEHSFTARAETLLAAALPLVGALSTAG